MIIIMLICQSLVIIKITMIIMIIIITMPKVPVFRCKKMAFRATRFKNGVQKPRETPPKMVG